MNNPVNWYIIQSWMFYSNSNNASNSTEPPKTTEPPKVSLINTVSASSKIVHPQEDISLVSRNFIKLAWLGDLFWLDCLKQRAP